jgi:hypothetical protein
MDPASDYVVLFKESDFGITDPDVDSSARTAASHFDTVATVSDSVILTTAYHSVIIFSPSGFIVHITASNFFYCCPPASDIRFLLRFPYQAIYFHIIAPYSD